MTVANCSEGPVSTPVTATAGCEDIMSNQARWSSALLFLREALQLLDQSEAPPELGAQLDQVINRLEASIHKAV